MGKTSGPSLVERSGNGALRIWRNKGGPGTWLLIPCLFLAFQIPSPAEEVTADPKAGASGEDEQWLQDMLQVMDESTEIATQTRLNADYVHGTVSVLQGRNLEALGVRNVWEALALIPGVIITENGRGELFIGVRGFSAPFNAGNIKVLLNTVPMSRDSSGLSSQALSLPIEQVERIEFIRGPGSVLYGDFAYNGVLNIFTRQDDTRVFSRVDEHGTGTIGGQYAYRSEDGKTRIGLNLAGLRGDSVEAPEGISADNDQESAIATLVHRRFKLTAQAIDRDYEGDRGITRSERTTALEARQSFDLAADTTAKVHISYVTNDLDDGVTRFRGHTWEGAAELSWEGMERHQWLLQVSYTDDGIDDAFQSPPPRRPDDLAGPPPVNETPRAPVRSPGPPPGSNGAPPSDGPSGPPPGNGGPPSDGPSGPPPRNGGPPSDGPSGPPPRNGGPPPDGPPGPPRLGDPPRRSAVDQSNVSRRHFGISLQDQYEATDRLSITAGLRFDHRYDLDRSIFTPRLAAVWRLSDTHILKAQYAGGYRAPTFWELYPNNFKIDLKPETIATSELSYINRVPDRLLRLTLFHSRLENHISPLGPPDFGFENVGTSRAVGVEVEFEKQWSPRLKSWFNLSYSDSRDGRVPFGGETGDQDPSTSDWLGNLALFFRPTERMLLTTHWNYVGVRHAEIVDSKAEHRVSATLNLFDLWTEGLTLRLGIRNLLEADQRHVFGSPTRVRASDFPDSLVWGQIAYGF